MHFFLREKSEELLYCKNYLHFLAKIGSVLEYKTFDICNFLLTIDIIILKNWALSFKNTSVTE